MMPHALFPSQLLIELSNHIPGCSEPMFKNNHVYIEWTHHNTGARLSLSENDINEKPLEVFDLINRMENRLISLSIDSYQSNYGGNYMVQAEGGYKVSLESQIGTDNKGDECFQSATLIQAVAMIFVQCMPTTQEIVQENIESLIEVANNYLKTEANEFLNTPHPKLNNTSPLEAIKSYPKRNVIDLVHEQFRIRRQDENFVWGGLLKETENPQILS